jgi:hypothetical protein
MLEETGINSMRAKVVGLPPPRIVLIAEYSVVKTIIVYTMRIGQQIGESSHQRAIHPNLNQHHR